MDPIVDAGAEVRDELLERHLAVVVRVHELHGALVDLGDEVGRVLDGAVVHAQPSPRLRGSLAGHVVAGGRLVQLPERIVQDLVVLGPHGEARQHVQWEAALRHLDGPLPGHGVGLLDEVRQRDDLVAGPQRRRGVRGGLAAHPLRLVEALRAVEQRQAQVRGRAGQAEPAQGGEAQALVQLAAGHEGDGRPARHGGVLAADASLEELLVRDPRGKLCVGNRTL